MAKKSRKKGVTDEDGASDPLGKLLAQYHVSLLGVLIVASVAAFVGLVVIVVGLVAQFYPIVLLLVGTGILLLAVVFLGMNAFNVGRRLELRKRGVRYTQAGVVTELFWDEIVAVEVNRTDDTYLGVASVTTRSSDAASPTGPLTSTEWDVTIHSNDGRKIRLPPAFLRTVPDPKKLISQLRLRAGLP